MFIHRCLCFSFFTPQSTVTFLLFMSFSLFVTLYIINYLFPSSLRILIPLHLTSVLRNFVTPDFCPKFRFFTSYFLQNILVSFKCFFSPLPFFSSLLNSNVSPSLFLCYLSLQFLHFPSIVFPLLMYFFLL